MSASPKVRALGHCPPGGAADFRKEGEEGEEEEEEAICYFSRRRQSQVSPPLIALAPSRSTTPL